MPVPDDEIDRVLYRIALALRQLTESITALARILQHPDDASLPLPDPLDLPDFPDSPGIWEEILVELFGDRLTDTERQVCARRVLGYKTGQIAGEFCVSVHTIDRHLQNIADEFNLHHAEQITPYVYRHHARRRRR